MHSFTGVAGLSTHTGVTWGHSFAGVAGLSTHGGGGGRRADQRLRPRVVRAGGDTQVGGRREAASPTVRRRPRSSPGGQTVGGVQIG